MSSVRRRHHVAATAMAIVMTVTSLPVNVAAAGMIFKLVSPTRWRPLAIATCLLLGWTVVVAFEPLFAAVSLRGIILLLTGGILYSIGVVFYRWTRLPYHRAIWHGFVLAAASCHFTVVFIDIALAGGQ